MKLFIYTTLILATCVVFSCKKKENTPSKYYGTIIEFDIDSCALMEDSAFLITQLNNTDTTIGGYSNSSHKYNGLCFLQMNKNISIGSYSLDASNITGINFSFYDNDPNLGPFLPLNGNLTILEHDLVNHNIKGTFYATLQESNNGIIRNISNGHFQFHY